MLSSLALLLLSAATLVQGAAVQPQPRAVSCPDLHACGGNNPYSDSDSTGTRCSYLRYGPAFRQITLFRCYYDNSGNIVSAPPGTVEKSDAICPSKNTGSCPAPTTTSIASTSISPPTQSVTPPPVLPGRRIHPNWNNAKCLDVRAANYANGTPVQIYDCNGTPAQNWLWNEASTKIQLANTNFCLDAGSNPGNGIGMKIWQCYSGLPAQQFYRTGDKRFAVEGKGQCLDLTDGRLENSVQSQTWACSNGNTNQIWTK